MRTVAVREFSNMGKGSLSHNSVKHASSIHAPTPKVRTHSTIYDNNNAYLHHIVYIPTQTCIILAKDLICGHSSDSIRVYY